MNMKNIKNIPTTNKIQDFEVAMQMALQRIHSEGAVDIESGALNAIREKVISGEITIEKGIKMINSILESRSNYH